MMAITEEELTLCVLIYYFLNPDEYTRSSFEPLQICREMVPFLLKHLKGNESVTYSPLADVIHELQGLGPVARQMFQIVLQVYQKLDSPDDICRVFGEFGKLLEKPTAENADKMKVASLDPGSVLGLFMRKCRARFKAMSFEALSRLFSEVKTVLRQHPAVYRQTLPGRKGGLREAPALDAFLNTQLHKSYQLGSTTPLSFMEQQLKDLQHLEGSHHKVLLLKLVDNMQHKNYNAALDALHSYFNHCKPTAGTPVEGAEGGKSGYHRALLMVSALHAHFGHTKEALDALDEALRLLQHQGDSWALSHALAALCRILANSSAESRDSQGNSFSLPPVFHQASHHAQIVKLLKRCQERGEELHCPHLTTYAQLELARLALQSSSQPAAAAAATAAAVLAGEQGAAVAAASAAPAQPALVQVRQAATAAANLQQQALLAAAAPSSAAAPVPRPAPGQPPVSRIVSELFPSTGIFSGTSRPYAAAAASSVHDLAGAAHLLQAAAWRQHGNMALAHTHALMYLCSYEETGRADDTAVAYAQLAQISFECQGVSAAEEVVRLAEERFPPPSHPVLEAAKLCIKHSTALNEGRLLDAAAPVEDLKALADAQGFPDLEVRLDAQRRHVMNLMAAGSWEPANTAAGNLFASCMEAGMQLEAVRALLLLARISQAASHPSGALPPVMSALLHAQALNAEILAAEANILLATSWLALQPAALEQVVALIERVMPTILAHGGLALQAEAQMMLADCFLCHARDTEQLKAKLPRVQHLLRDAVSAYGKVCMREQATRTRYLLAQAYNLSGHLRERDEVAAECLASLQISHAEPVVA